jgi:transposase
MVEGYERRIAALEAELAEVKARLNQNSQNSSRPPSSDGPQVKRKPPHPPSGRKRRAWLWVVVTQGVSVFCIRASRGAKVLWELLGEEYGGVLTSDRAQADNGQPLQSRQICWAHLRRDFQAMIDRGGAGAAVGEILLEQAEVLFGWWHWVRDGTWAPATFPGYMHWLRGAFQQELAAGARCACPQTAATCQELLKVEPALWTFGGVPGLAPTHNAAARALRHPVQWRKTSYGTDSLAGSHF